LGRVQGVEHAREIGCPDAVSDERVQHRRAVVETPNDRGQVGGGVEAAVLRRANRAQHDRGARERGAIQRIDAPLRNDRVEH
jgi:hypothetical protein